MLHKFEICTCQRKSDSVDRIVIKSKHVYEVLKYIRTKKEIFWVHYEHFKDLKCRKIINTVMSSLSIST